MMIYIVVVFIFFLVIMKIRNKIQKYGKLKMGNEKSRIICEMYCIKYLHHSNNISSLKQN